MTNSGPLRGNGVDAGDVGCEKVVGAGGTGPGGSAGGGSGSSSGGGGGRGGGGSRGSSMELKHGTK